MSKQLFKQAEFILSASKLKECPPDVGAEVAFAGRSNAGKSSAINALTSNNKLARTSKTPGRTQLINFFAMDEQWRLVDLPGHGYAKVPISIRDHWQKHLDKYLRGRKTLCGLVLLMDVRHPLQPFDQALLDWATGVELPVHILLTKADKLKFGPAKSTLLQVQQALADKQGITIQLFSALKNKGVDDAKRRIISLLQDATPKMDDPDTSQP